MGEDLGYDRVSTRDQNPEPQEAELRAAGCTRVFIDHGVSSRIADRPAWRELLEMRGPETPSRSAASTGSPAASGS